MKNKLVVNHIVNWLTSYSNQSKTDGFVVGISGGIDSALTSTLCALTGKKVICITMPIRQMKNEYDRGKAHMEWLQQNFKNVSIAEVNLTPIFEEIESTFENGIQDFLTMANTRARLRMTTLFAYAGHHKLLVAGTGNKIEDFGIGFYTKYGDGGVDVSPIADLLKSEVFLLGKTLNVIESIQNAAPTDGLWGDQRTDEDQIGAKYSELEWAMQFKGDEDELTTRQKEVLSIYRKLNAVNQHKMLPIPVCSIPSELRI